MAKNKKMSDAEWDAMVKLAELERDNRALRATPILPPPNRGRRTKAKPSLDELDK